MAQHLYISDLDGTLLRDDTSISSWAHKELSLLIDQGVHFTIATARSVFSAKQILGELPLELPMVGGNGAYISDFLSGSHHEVKTISAGICQEVLDILLEHDIHPFVTTHGPHQDHLYISRATDPLSKAYLQERIETKDPRLKMVGDIEESLEESVICFTLVGQEERIQEMTKLLHQIHPGRLEINYYENHYTPGWYWLNIHDRLSTKANGIKVVAEQAGFGPENTTVFGDNLNDISMFQWAGRSIAVENARPELKEHAHHIIGSNQVDSVVKFILEDLEQKG